MGELVNGRLTNIVNVVITLVVTVLNVLLLYTLRPPGRVGAVLAPPSRDAPIAPGALALSPDFRSNR